MRDTELDNAPLWKRTCSIIYDFVVLVAVSLFYFACVTAIETLLFKNTPENFQPNASGIVAQMGWLMTIVGFYCFFWLRVGQTVAMKAWRLRLIKKDATRLRFSDCLLRIALGFLGFSLCGIGYLWIKFDKEKLALHDRLSNTRVVLLPKENK